MLRRTFLSLAAVATTLLSPRWSVALDVPARVQARLLAKVAEYDRNLVKREGTRVVVLVRKARDAESTSHADEMASELASIERIAGGAHRETIVEFLSPAALRATILAQGAAIVYLSSGLAERIGAIAEASEGLTVLTVGAEAGDAERGAVLGFDMVSGRCQLVVNLARSRAQNVAFRPDFLRLARVIR